MGRLARNLDDLRRIVQGMTRGGIRVEFVKGGLGFTGNDSPMSTVLLLMMGAFAESRGPLSKSVVAEDTSRESRPPIS
jgi:DNA invertase Pin-like site-specific DNA recombinase